MTEKFTILLAEDEPDVRSLFKYFFEQEGYKVLEAADGKAALELFKKNKVDIIITDQRMPRMSGIELAQTILTEQNQVPVIIVTGYSDVPTDYAYGIGVRRILNKPVPIEELLQEIRLNLTPLPYEDFPKPGSKN